MFSWLIPRHTTISIICNDNNYYFVLNSFGYINYYYCGWKNIKNISVDLKMGVIYHDFKWLEEYGYKDLMLFFRGWNTTLGYKIKFKRKGSWMRLKRYWPQFVSLKVGLGHYQRINIDDMFPIRYKKHLRRHSILLLGCNWLKMGNSAKKIQSYRPMNSYTKRGIRLARQLFYRKQGKQNKYKALKSKIY